MDSNTTDLGEALDLIEKLVNRVSHLDHHRQIPTQLLITEADRFLMKHGRDIKKPTFST